jgi:hypothetical protein
LAIATAEEALTVAAGRPVVADHVRVTQAGLMAAGGRFEEAEALLARVIEADREPAAAEALAQTAAVALGRGDQVLAADLLAAAIPRLPADSVWLGNALTNLGLIKAFGGNHAEAQQLLTTGLGVFEAAGCAMAAAETRFNLAWLAEQRGDYVTALVEYAAIEPVMVSRGEPVGHLHESRAQTLMAVGLASLAAEEAAAAVADFARIGAELNRADAMLVEADALHLCGDHEAAAAAARSAVAAFTEQGRPGRSDQAALARLRAEAAADMGGGHLAEARALATRLAASGVLAGSLEARLTAARIATSTGDLAGAASDLAVADAARRSPRPDIRIGYWDAQAALRRTSGDLAGSLIAARAGLEVLDESRQTLGATEARVNVGATARRLGQIGLAAVVADGPAGRVFDWMERARAGALLFRPVRPPHGDTLAELRAELRTVSHEVAAAEGSTRGSLDQIRRRQGELERAIRYHLLATPGEAAGVERLTASRVRELLGDRVLISYAEMDGRLVAVVLTGRRASFVDLGELAPIRTELDHLRFALLRVATGRGSEATSEMVSAGSERLADQVLPASIRRDRPLVVIPTGDLLAVPWAVLPGVAGRPVAVAPSASLWGRAVTTSPGADRVVVAAGPGLEHAERELDRIGAIHPGSVLFPPNEATTTRVLAAADGAGMLHVACHGVFRVDNPLFSNLRLADGPLHVHDFETLGTAPSTVILSACDSGLAQPRPGDEWLGMAAALLTLGTRSLVASVLPVPDEQPTIDLMARFHSSLRAGAGASEALASASTAVADRVVGAAFVCFGS